MLGDVAVPPSQHRMRRWEIGGDVRFVTFSCHRRLPLLGSAAVRDVFAESLQKARARFNCELFAWVAMPEHVHLLMRPRGGELGPVLRSTKLSVAQRVIERWRELDAPILLEMTSADGRPRFWQKGGGFDRNVRDFSEFSRHVRYIHRNPAKRGLVEDPADWRWSSLRWWMGERSGPVSCDTPPGPPGSWDSWKGFV